jgi:hypothetical protein
MGRFTVISTDAFDALQVDAGVILTNFDPADPYKTPKSSDILATTSGGVNPVYETEFTDYGEDVDNVPNNMMEFKRLTNQTASISFSSIKFNAENTKWALGAADTELLSNGVTVVKPRRDVLLSDFRDIWWVGDKANGGAYAIKLLNALSTGGLNIQSSKNGKGTNAITVTGHVSIHAQEVMPMMIYDIPPEDAPIIPDLTLDRANITIAEGETEVLTAKTIPADQTVTWTSSDDTVATVEDGEVTAVAEGTAVITASMTYETVEYKDTCKVTVTA